MPAPPGLRGSAAEMVATVPLPQPFSMSDYLRRIEALRATRIFVEPAAGLLPPGAPCGLWVHIDGTDFIFHAPSSSPAYVDHIVRHELGHLLWEHTGSAGLSEEYVARLLPDLDPAMAVKVLGRASYNTEQE